MTEILTAAQMRAIEKAAIDSGEVTGLELMERAGAGVVEAVMAEWPELAQSSYKAVVLCGPGNNGGDGFVIARLLKQRGWEVEVFLYGDPEKLPPDAKVNYERWGEMGEVLPFTSYSERKTWACSLVVDALFGTGLTRAAPELGELFWNMEDMVDCFAVEPNHPLGRPAIVAVDIPSGLCADSGRDFEIEEHWWRASATAHLTVSFHSAKRGHYLFDGPQKCGKLVVVDIGLSKGRPAKLNSPVKAVGPIHKAWLDKGGDSHKYTHGHALILSGLSGKTGAARLAARAALRVGAGLVTLGTPHEAVTEVAAQITALMLTEIDTPEILSRVLTDKRLNALCIGPGFGVARAAEFLPHALAAKRATVLDADALTALSESEIGFADLHENCVLTPHAGEFKRLFPDIAAKLAEPPTKGPAYSKVDASRAAAERAGCTVLFKGPDTVIASPNGRCSINAAVYERAAPWLATAGSGDVLAGLITGLLARGFTPHQACETAAWLHTEAARSFGPGLIAEDLPEELPKVFRTLDL
ncbi:NAD(P)H-hydrate dehydratase [Celeribacter sp. HF31]|uniref:NAD(P)H-hydrate dehydratase n=1 Tax=Celeribacter sp. HF31 TaxID=2721558 RepID=UPI00142FD520|nr:NAD(P)H-hydrate dehydratase [Celeribacter sp. HF31]NIY78999.1 NAD(P)H-hydrate dehydratase [Celeribacter sp. HF31]